MLSRIQKIYFGMARFGPSIMLDMLDLATTLFYFSVAGLPAIYTGISIAAGYIAIMSSEFGFGSLSDRSPTRWGRRKPFVMIGAPLMAISFLFVFSPTWFVAQDDVIGLFIYALATQVMFKVSYGLTMTPFQAWMPELTEPEERPSVSSWQNVANFLGFVIGVFGGVLIATEAIQQTISEQWILPSELLTVFLIFVAIQLFGFIIPLARLKKEGKYIEHSNLKEDLRTAIKNRDFILWMAAQGLLSIGFSMVIRTAFPYINDYLMFSDMDFILFGVELLTIVFVFFAIWRWMIKNKGKRFTLQTAMLLAACSLPLTLIITQRILGFLLIALVGAGVAGYYLFPYIIYADFAHKDEILTGEGKAGLYTGFPTLTLNTCQAISALIWGVVFSLPEVVPVPGFPAEDPLTLGYLLWGPIAGLFLFLSVLVLFKVDLDPDFKALEASMQDVETDKVTLGNHTEPEDV